MLTNISIIVSILALDQITKHFSRLYYNKDHILFWNNFLEIHDTWNHGISFGLFNKINPLIIIVINIIFITYLACLLATARKNTTWSLALSLIIGGALGNIIDRIRFGAVYDFISLHINEFYWPDFNLADSAICIGVFLITLDIMFNNRKIIS